MGCINSAYNYDAGHGRFSSIEEDNSDPVKLIILTDPGQDLDDEMAFIMVRHLVHLRLAKVIGVVTTLAPAFDRARLIRGACDVLGLLDVPIGVGSDGGDVARKHKAETFTEWAEPYMAPPNSAASDSFKPGRHLLRKIYTEAEEKSLTFVVISSLKDAAIFLRDAEDLFIEKTREVVIMGGVKPWAQKEGEPIVLEPDTANNNTFDFRAAVFFYQRCQELSIPLIVVTRWCAYASRLPATCYNELAATGSWIGCRVRNAQRKSIEYLWSRAASPSGSDLRGTLPDRCNREWFLHTFCAGHPAPGRGANDTIWDLVQGFMQYDTMAALAAIPSLREELFNPVKVEGLHGIEHMVIGKTEQEHNVKNTTRLIDYVYQGFKAGLSYNHRRKVSTILLLQPRWHNHAETLVACLVLRAVCELDIMDCAGIILQPVPAGIVSESLEKLFEDVATILSQVGLAHVPVRVATRYTTGADHLLQLYQKVSPAGLTLVIAATLDVAADFASKHPAVFVQKTQKVIVVGAGKLVPAPCEDGEPIEMVVVPDGRAQNFAADLPAAQRFFKAVQSLLVPLVTVSREFAQVVHIPRSFYDSLRDAHHGGRVGKYLYEVQRENTAEFWKAVCSRKGSAARKSLPDSLDRMWFIDTFCSGMPPASDRDEDVWSCMKYFNVYNAQAILLALPPVFNRFVLGTTVELRHVTHTIVGNSVDDPGIVEPGEFQRLILQCMVTATRLTSSAFDLEDPESIQLDNDNSTWTWDTRKNALDWLLPLEHQKRTSDQILGESDDDPESPEKSVRMIITDLMGTTSDLWRAEPLHKVMSAEECEETLSEAGAEEVNNQHGQNTPLHFAAYKGEDSTVRNLLEAAPQVQHHVMLLAKNEYGSTPLHDAVQEGHRSTAKVLVDAASQSELLRRDVLLITDGWGDTVLHTAASVADNSTARNLLKDSPETLREEMLLFRNRSDNYNTPLHVAALKGHESTARVLLEGAPADLRRRALLSKDAAGNTPSHVASVSGHESTAKILLEAFSQKYVCVWLDDVAQV